MNSPYFKTITAWRSFLGSSPSTSHWLLVLTCATGWFLGCTGVDQTENKAADQRRLAVQAVIEADEAIAARYLPSDPNNALWTWLPNYLSELRAIELTTCPPDFREAYLRHLHVLEELDAWAPRDPSVLDTFIFALTTNIPADVTEFDRRLKTTWQEVEILALRHGVSVPAKQVSLLGDPKASR